VGAGAGNLAPPPVKPMLPWEDIVKAAYKISDTNGTDNVDRVEAFMLACAVVYFDVAMRTGGTKLPASWRQYAPHAAGYERPRLECTCAGRDYGLCPGCR
jgi:hypothetical protein